MKLEKTRLVFEDSQRVVSDNELESESVASYLAEYILIIFYTEMEEKIAEIIEKFLEKHSNSGIAKFLSNTFKKRFKRIDKGLRETLGLFGRHKETKFNTLAHNDSTKPVFAEYLNLIEARHSVAHSGMTKNISWAEASKAANIGEKILEIFEDSLNFEPPQPNR